MINLFAVQAIRGRFDIREIHVRWFIMRAMELFTVGFIFFIYIDAGSWYQLTIYIRRILFRIQIAQFDKQSISELDMRRKKKCTKNTSNLINFLSTCANTNRYNRKLHADTVRTKYRLFINFSPFQPETNIPRITQYDIKLSLSVA